MVHPAVIHSKVLISRLFAIILKDTFHQNGGILNCAWLDWKCYAKYSK